MKKKVKKDAESPNPDDGLEDILGALQNIYAIQAKENPTALREPERSVADVCWNAIVMGHPNRFQEMSQVFSVASRIATKLAALKALPAAAMPYAPVVFSGLLNFIWRSQNLMYLDPQLAEGWAGTLQVAIAELSRDWAPPAGKPWFARLAEFAVAVDATLRKLEAYKWEEIYKHLDRDMNKLQTLAKEILAHVQAKYPSSLPAATAWTMGTIIQKNTYSPWDGSVPESFSERLTSVYNALESNAEGGFMAWLGAGFQSVREKPLDELQRWKASIESDEGTRKKPARSRRKGQS